LLKPPQESRRADSPKTAVNPLRLSVRFGDRFGDFGIAELLRIDLKLLLRPMTNLGKCI
jgi:hypothetical protein